jgi:hypothetical protein
MHYGVAIAISIVLILGSFGYVELINSKVQQWKDSEVALPAIIFIAVTVARFMDHWWYVILALSIAFPLTVASISPKRVDR